jgi:hypothetical protein
MNAALVPVPQDLVQEADLGFWHWGGADACESAAGRQGRTQRQVVWEVDRGSMGVQNDGQAHISANT